MPNEHAVWRGFSILNLFLTVLCVSIRCQMSSVSRLRNFLWMSMFSLLKGGQCQAVFCGERYCFPLDDVVSQ